MGVAVFTEVVIERPRSVVAKYVGDPSNAPSSHVDIKSAGWKRTPLVAVGSQMAFTAHFLAKRLESTCEVV